MSGIILSVRTMPSKSELEYQRALKDIEELMDARPGSSEGERLKRMATLVEAFEAEHYPVEEPSHPAPHEDSSDGGF